MLKQDRIHLNLVRMSITGGSVRFKAEYVSQSGLNIFCITDKMYVKYVNIGLYINLYAHQICIYLIKKYNKTIINIITI